MVKLQPVCAYQGGKGRIASMIVDRLLEDNPVNDQTRFYDLCCGSGAISIELVNRGISPNSITMVDKGVWGLFWQMIGEGSFDIGRFEKWICMIPTDPADIQRFMKQLAKAPASVETPYVYLLLQASAFGSKQIWIEQNQWKNTSFRNYWLPTETSNRKSPVNPMMPMPDTLFKRVKAISEKMRGVAGIYGDIERFFYEDIQENSIIIIDPPYQNTTRYGSGHTVDILRFVKDIGRKVYVCEGVKLTDTAYQITGSRKKGGITGSRKSQNEEWLNLFNGEGNQD